MQLNASAYEGAALHATQPGQSQENLVVPPVTGSLGWKAFMQQFYLALRTVATVIGRYIDGRLKSPSHLGIS